MNRVLLFDLDNRQSDEIHSPCVRGWSISNGGSGKILLSLADQLKRDLQFGHMVFVAHPHLPGWAGMIDTPWDALPPVGVTVYDVPYLLRVKPFGTDVISGNIEEIANRFLDLAGQLTNHGIQLGDVSGRARLENYPITQAAIWDQLKDLASKTNTEIQFRSEVDQGQLRHWLDIVERLGADTDLVLHDGEGANARFSNATVDGDFKNAILGVSTDSTGSGKKKSDIYYDEESQKLYRTRNDILQFSVKEQGDLEAAAEAALSQLGRPYVTFTASAILNKDANEEGGPIEGKVDGEQLRLGNRLLVRSSRMILPGGRQGWSGTVRITAMSYDPANNSVSMALKGEL